MHRSSVGFPGQLCQLNPDCSETAPSPGHPPEWRLCTHGGVRCWDLPACEMHTTFSLGLCDLHIHSIGQHFLGSTGDDAGWGRCQERTARGSPSTASNNAAAALLLAEQTQQVLELRGGAWKKAVPDIMCNWLHAPLFLYLMLFTKDLSL